MLRNKKFIKKTKKGNIVKIVREHYLRDDIKSGTGLDPECGPEDVRLSSDAQCYLVVDTNVVLHHIDLLEHSGVEDVIVPSIVLQEVKNKNTSVYDRLRSLTNESSNRRFFVFQNEHHRNTYVTQEKNESANDRNDRAIRVAAKWYADLLTGKMEVVLLSDDVSNRHKAETELGLKAMSALQYAQSRMDCKELIDIAQRWSQDDMEIDCAPSKSFAYAEHLSMSELKSSIKSGRLHQGTLTTSRSCWYCGMIEPESLDTMIKIVGLRNINRAVSGDVVVVELLEGEDADAAEEDAEEEAPAVEVAATDFGGAPIGESGAMMEYPLGRVVGIIKRNWRARGYCGSIKPPRSSASGSRTVVFKPMDRRIPPLLLKTSQAQELVGSRIVVALDAWPADSRLPTGHYVRKLGNIGDKDVETEALLLENDISSCPFSPAVHSCLPSLPWSVSEGDLGDPERMDLRHLCVCSIDPPDCKDIDDALHVRELGNKNYEIGVHIADVTNFVKPDTPVDEEAARRSTTVYLVQKAISMLPKALTEEICSLKSGVDRLAFSVMWEVTPEGDIIADNTVFSKSIIRSRASLSYAEAQTRIDDERLDDELTKNLRLLNAFGKVFRKRRKENGALDLASAEVRFQIDSETQDPTDVATYQALDTNKCVEEMMLLANETVAEKILEAFPSSACLRRHPPPNENKFKPLCAALKSKDLVLDTKSNKTLSTSLDAAVDEADPYFNTLVRMMTTRCMNEAQYFISGEFAFEDYCHYGLAMNIYTHFTSPIRRYADVLVHRLLGAAIGIYQVPRSFGDAEHMATLTKNMNNRHKNAQNASRASASLYTLVFFKNKSVVENGWISGFARAKNAGLVVQVQKYGIEGRVSKIYGVEGDRSGFAPVSKTELKSKASNRIYRIFDRVQVRLEVAASNNDYDQELALYLVES